MKPLRIDQLGLSPFPTAGLICQLESIIVLMKSDQRIDFRVNGYSRVRDFGGCGS
jgi:hypothetical protein